MRSRLIGWYCKNMFSCIGNWWAIFQLSFKVAMPFCIPTNSELWQQNECEVVWLHIFVSIWCLYFGCSNRWVMVSCCFDLSFFDNICCGGSFHIFVCHLHILFGEVSVKAFGPVFSWCKWKKKWKKFLFYSYTCNISAMRCVYGCVCFYSINSLTLLSIYDSVPFSSDTNWT